MSNLFFNNEFINTTIKSYLERKLEGYNNVKYAYAIMNKKNPAQFSIISNRTEWFDVYTANNYQFIDPVLITAAQRVSPFAWDENIVINSGLKIPKIFDSARDYDFVNGYTFVIHDPNNNLVVLSIIIDKSCDENMEKLVADSQPELQMLLIATHEKMTSLYNQASSNAEDEKIDKEIFSRRENEIVYWASMGKTYPEIALILGIKLSTVKFHIGNAVKKLGVTNAKHAIRLGVELQLIRPIFPDAKR
ncbi:helix-turn-helix transcriptional regulator [Pantoea sp. B65]|uniref:helix-turn-helix transcriptional regulator n=1 Tax=Pantoea sp. B65 TaxID=2813359 RepID=UPI0039B4F93B